MVYCYSKTYNKDVAAADDEDDYNNSQSYKNNNEIDDIQTD